MRQSSTLYDAFNVFVCNVAYLRCLLMHGKSVLFWHRLEKFNALETRKSLAVTGRTSMLDWESSFSVVQCEAVVL